ncbi:PEGA domain-containing protein [Ruficoccus amylovorans]|uniref:PEGA domain-containing protein n=1 Tax=Ruficoccus amylovorans TaxID=1804625 RepID=A0A842HHA5_9BACT|nr:PEGA domain-containing protein [Ruficoccus amylovorans]MBC2596115.1 PEGA domain-containing protein [Ruficoccus amylovorans]
MFKKVNLLVPALLISVFATGCSTFEKGSPEAVEVQSFPPGANVYVNGDLVGQTPYTVELGRKSTATVEVEKDGYRTKTVSVAPIENENSRDVVQFGLLHEVGYYQSLSPNPISVQLVPNEIPTSRSADQYGEMLELISVVDQQRESGQIDPVEHKYKVEKIIEFYTE